jgi:Sulfotransferase domain
VTNRIYLVSGPRNISTALMYSFRSRFDTTVYDEPLYGHYLAYTGIEHPGRDEVLATEPTDGAAAITDIILGHYDTPVAFFKSMGHHTLGVGLDLAFLEEVTSVFLTREPRAMLASLVRNLPDATVEMTGLPYQVELVEQIVARGGSPVVVDSKQILVDPPAALAQLCSRIGIPWDAAMLTWPAGPKPEDGIWAKHWYAGVHATTGFTPYRERDAALPERYDDLLAECERHHAALSRYAIDVP